MKAVLFIGNNYKFNKEDIIDSYVVGVDKGALYCLKNNIKMDVAVGDFDSVSPNDYELIIKATKIVKLNPVKDDTDTEHALKMIKDYDEITILGGIKGNRIEHFISMLIYLKNFPNLRIKDDNSLIYTIDKDQEIIKDNIYKFISLFSLEDDTIVSLRGFKYNLNNYHLKENDPLGVSNEIVDDKAYIELKGRLIIVKSKDDNVWKRNILSFLA